MTKSVYYYTEEMGNLLQTMMTSAARANPSAATQPTQGGAPSSTQTAPGQVAGATQQSQQGQQQSVQQTAAKTAAQPAPYRPPASKDPPNVVTERFKLFLQRAGPQRPNDEVISRFKEVIIRPKQTISSATTFWIVFAVVLFIAAGIIGWCWYRKNRTTAVSPPEHTGQRQSTKQQSTKKVSKPAKENEPVRTTEAASVQRKTEERASAKRPSTRASPTATIRKDIARAEALSA